MNELHDMNVHYARKLTRGFVLSRTYRIYQERFWELFRTGLPVALLVYVFTPLQRMLVRQLLVFLEQHGLVEFSPASWPFWLLMSVITFITGAVYWSLNAIFFAGIAGKLINNDDDDEPRLISDAYSRVRRRLPALLVVALLTWTAFELTRILVNLALVTLLNRLHFFPDGSLATYLIFGLPLAVIGGLVSRAALAVPELIDDPTISAFRAIRNSIRKMENWEPFIIFFLIKTAIVGYGIYWVAGRGFHVLWARTSISASAYSWMTWGVYVCLFAMVESPLFIAFCVFYRELQFKQEAALTAPAIG